jgi:hypothetical protein
MRLQHGLFADAVGHGIMAIAFAVLMFLVVVELMYSLRTRVEFHDDKVRMTLPSGRGPTPMLRYKTHEIPYDQVQTVETRREIYGGSFAPMLLQGARVIMKDGTKVPIGYVAEANVDPAFPYPEIAKHIADRARLPLIDRGSVWRSVRRKFLGLGVANLAGAEDTVDEAQIARLNNSHKNMVLGLVGVLVILMAIGIVEDFSSDLPIGQTASTIVAPITSSQKPASKPAKPAKPAN